MSLGEQFDNIIINTDNYKHCHYQLYPAGTEYISSYVESRGGEFPVVMFVGLQAFLRDYLMRPVTVDDVDAAEYLMREHGMPFNRDGWMGIINDHAGYLPVEIEAVAEGTVLPTNNVLIQIINTDPKYYWVTSFFETALLRAVWYPTTVGTLSWLCKQVIRNALERTSDNVGALRFMLHDYGARGVSSQQSAALGGMAHLVNFSGSDTTPGILAAKRWYNAVAPSKSGPNSEHSCFTAWGRDQEIDAIRNMLEVYRDHGIALVLTDSYDHENCIKNILGGELKEMIQNFPGLVCARPDSGDIVRVTADTIEWLMESFGYETNSKGFRILPKFIRVAQGDGVTGESLRRVYAEMERRGLAADNAIFGMGGGLLQNVNRDTNRFAQKANAICVNGHWRNISKSPTGEAYKASKAGRLALICENGEYKTVPRDSVSAEQNLLKTVFRNGNLVRKWDFSEVIAASETPVPQHWYQSWINSTEAGSKA